MLLEAFNWDGTERFTLEQIKADPHTEIYLGGWKRAADFGVIAVEHHQPLGALWARALPASSPGYGYVADDVPEIGMAVPRTIVDVVLARHCLTKASSEPESSAGAR